MDIVERLRKIDFTFWYSPISPDERFEPIEIGKMSKEAADEIELLRKERDGLREALTEIADYQKHGWVDGITDIARAALNEVE